jgi:D-alanine-D-alanine ligase
MLLCEELIAGRECTVAVLDGDVLGVLEIVTRDGRYDYETKYHRTDNEYRVLAVDGPDAAMVQACSVQAARAYGALNCRGMARVDVMVDERGPWVLEVNTLPGMTATSLVPKIAAALGWSFETLVARMLDSARLDDGGHS